MSEDWLALPEEAMADTVRYQPPAVPLDAPITADELDAAVVDLTPPKASDQALEAASALADARARYQLAWGNLNEKQVKYLSVLPRVGFSQTRALKTLNEFGIKIFRANVSKWQRTDEDFKHVLQTLRLSTVEQVTSRDELLMRAHRAAEYAEEEQPILHQGADTGFRERKVGEMLRANEQLMKATKVLGSDDVPRGAEGPALIIQVVQSGGNVIDITPKGVTIDLPKPGGNA